MGHNGDSIVTPAPSSFPKLRGWAKRKQVAYTAQGNLLSRRDGDRIR